MESVKDDFRIEQWFQLASIKDSSRDPYIRYMQRFCDLAGKTPTQLIEESNNEVRAGKLVNERNIIIYLTKFKKYITDKKYAPKTQALAMASVKSFFATHNVQLPARMGEMKNVKPLREHMTFLTREDIKKLISNAKSLRMRAFILMMATSGMARNEILNLKIKDITYDEDNVGTVTARREKSQVDYITFISPEASVALQNYIEERNRTKELRVKSKEDYVFVTYGSNGIGHKGEKLGGRSFMRHFRDLGEELNYDSDIKKGQFIKTRSHSLRKFFTRTLEQAKMPRETIDYLIGHTNTGNALAYYGETPDIPSLKKTYVEFLPYLAFEHEIKIQSLNSDDAKELSNLKGKMSEMELAYKNMQELSAQKEAALEKVMHKSEIMNETFEKLVAFLPAKSQQEIFIGMEEKKKRK